MLINLWNSVRNHPEKMFGHFVVAFGISWTFIEAVDFFFLNDNDERNKLAGTTAAVVIVVISSVYAAWKRWRPSRVEIPLTNSNTVIELTFGDLFNQDGLKAISANEYFDSKLGKPVSENSLHGILLTREFGGLPEAFDSQIAHQLTGVESVHVDRSEGKTERFPIGSAALLEVSGNKYIVFALAKTHIETGKAHSNVLSMWKALEGLWRKARIEAGGETLNVPLVGTGLSGVGISIQDSINLIVLSAIVADKQERVTNRIRVVIPNNLRANIDLRRFRQFREG